MISFPSCLVALGHKSPFIPTERKCCYLFTLTWSLVCTSKDGDITRLQSYIFSLEAHIDFPVSVIVVRVL